MRDTILEGLSPDKRREYDDLVAACKKELCPSSDKARALPNHIREMKVATLQDSKLGEIGRSLVEYLFCRLEIIAKSQICVHDGLRLLLSSAFYPLLESSYMLELYSDDSDDSPPTDIKVIAMAHLSTLRALFSYVVNVDMRHNTPTWVEDSCDDIYYAATNGCIDKLIKQAPNYPMTVEYPKQLTDLMKENRKVWRDFAVLIPNRGGNTYHIDTVVGAAGDGASVWEQNIPKSE